MPKYKVKMFFPSGDEEFIQADDSYEDKVFDSEDEALDEARQFVSDSVAGSEVLHLSNPGDYDEYDYDDYDYEIVEFDD